MGDMIEKNDEYVREYGPENLGQFPFDDAIGGWFCKDCDAPWGRGHYPDCQFYAIDLSNIKRDRP